MSHLNEKIDYTVEVFLVYQNKVLLRKHDKYGIWLSVGGHIGLNEDPNEAAVREVAEEVGLKIILDDSLLPPTPPSDTEKDLIPPYYLHRNRINPTHEHITFIYFAKSDSDQIILSTQERTDDVRWFTKDEILSHTDLKGNIRFYALEALEKLGNK